MRRPLLETPTRTASGAVVGRPRKELQPIAVKRIAKRMEQLAARGRGIAGVAALLRMDRQHLRRWMQEYPELSEAFERGTERRRYYLEGLIERDARKGAKPNVNAMFLLKTRYGYREGDPGEQPSRLHITFNLPGPMNREDFLKTVVAANDATE